MADERLLASLSLDRLERKTKKHVVSLGPKKSPFHIISFEFYKFIIKIATRVSFLTTLRVRGLPYSCCGAEVVEFFSDQVNMVNGEAGVHFTLTKGARF